MDDQRITVLETRFDCILPTLATKSDVETLRSEILFKLRKLESARGSGVAEPSVDFDNTLKNFKIWACILVGAIWMLALWLNVAVYVEGERIIARRQAVAAAAQAGPVPPAPILKGGNERQ